MVTLFVGVFVKNDCSWHDDWLGGLIRLVRREALWRNRGRRVDSWSLHTAHRQEHVLQSVDLVSVGLVQLNLGLADKGRLQPLLFQRTSEFGLILTSDWPNGLWRLHVLKQLFSLNSGLVEMGRYCLGQLGWTRISQARSAHEHSCSWPLFPWSTVLGRDSLRLLNSLVESCVSRLGHLRVQRPAVVSSDPLLSIPSRGCFHVSHFHVSSSFISKDFNDMSLNSGWGIPEYSIWPSGGRCLF